MNEGNVIGWRQLREFADVDLTKSFVLSWHVEAEALIIDIDLYLEPQHPFFEKPRPAEKVCIRAAHIEFPWCDVLSRGKESGKPIEIIEKIGLGAISDLRVVGAGHYAISGEFGTVRIRAERPILRLEG